MLSECYSNRELHILGFKSIGQNVLISRKCSLYAIEGQLGNNVRIDDFSMLSGKVVIGNHVHISAYCYLGGTHALISIGDFCGISQKVSIFTGSDDFRGASLNNPTVPKEFTNVRKEQVTLGRGCLIGAHSVILPGVTIGEGASIGALCVISKPVEPGDIIVSIQTMKVGTRDVQSLREMMAAVEEQDRQPADMTRKEGLLK